MLKSFETKVGKEFIILNACLPHRQGTQWSVKREVVILNVAKRSEWISA